MEVLRCVLYLVKGSVALCAARQYFYSLARTLTICLQYFEARHDGYTLLLATRTPSHMP
jgi:hypothetical protein